MQSVRPYGTGGESIIFSQQKAVRKKWQQQPFADDEFTTLSSLGQYPNKVTALAITYYLVGSLSTEELIYMEVECNWCQLLVKILPFSTQFCLVSRKTYQFSLDVITTSDTSHCYESVDWSKRKWVIMENTYVLWQTTIQKRGYSWYPVFVE